MSPSTTSPPRSPSPENDVFGFSEEFVSAPEYKQAGTASVSFDGLLDPPLLLHEDLAEGCGGMLWPAGMRLAKYLLKARAEEMRNAESIIELGAGGGLVGLAIAKGLAPLKTPLHITDQQPMLSLMHRNTSLNSLQTTVTPSIYDWGEPTPADLPAQPEIILAADCIYFEPAFPLLLRTLTDLVGERTTCYFCFVKRRRADLTFVKAARKVFDVEEVRDDPFEGEWRGRNVFFYTIRKKGSRQA